MKPDANIPICQLTTLMLINKYLLHNDLFNEVLEVGGNNSSCRVKMPCGEQNFALIDYVKKQLSVKATLTAKNNIATIKFRSK